MRADLIANLCVLCGFCDPIARENSLEEAVEQHEAHKYENDDLYGSSLSEGHV